MENTTPKYPGLATPRPSSTGKTLMIVDDEATVRDVLTDVLSSEYRVVTAASGEEALQSLSVHDPDLILLDLKMPGMSGLELLEKVRKSDNQVPVVVLTATTSYQSAVDAMKLGAMDYLAKPFDASELRHSIARTLSSRNLYNEVQYHRRQAVRANGSRDQVAMVTGESASMAQVMTRIKQVAPTPSTVLITGESGTGKELVARALHQLSDRRDNPFIALNCAAIPETLIEAELFGHEKGAFTSATGKRIGHFELADTGTLFLDELGDLSLATQAKLLRVLQEREFTRVGGGRSIRVDVRLVAATNKNLEAAIADTTFREDLYYRVNVFPISLPPLRERREDILPLAEHFLANRLSAGRPPRRLAQDALEMLTGYHWPGNIRELENVLEQALILSEGDILRAGDLPAHLSRRPAGGGSAGIPVGSPAGLSADLPFDEAVAEFERELIVRALNQTGFVQTRAATALGITRRVLKYKMDQLDIPARPTYTG